MADARLFQALSDPTRLKIMSLLAGGPMNVSGMVARLGCAQPAVSRHLRVLRDVALIRDERKGKEVEYSVNLAQLGDAAGYLGGLVEAAETAAAEVSAAATGPARSGKQDRAGISGQRGSESGKATAKPAGVKPAARRSVVEGHQPPAPEAADVVVGWAQQPRPRPPAKTEAGAEAQARPASRVGGQARATSGAEAGGKPRPRAESKAKVSPGRAAASGKAAKPAKAGPARQKPKPKGKPRPKPRAKPKSRPKPKPKPKPPAQPEYVIKRRDDTMDDFLL